MDAAGTKIQFLPHHEQKSLCTTRSPYRQGKKLTAVKVYTVNDESVHLLIHGVPSIGLQSEVSMLCERYGRVKSAKLVDQYSPDQEEFTNIYHVQFERIQSARFAKKILDNRSFFGSVLHVCYAPELETIQETKLKLVNRKREIAKRTRYLATDETEKSSHKLKAVVKNSFKSSCKEESFLGSNSAPNFDNSIPTSSTWSPSTAQNINFSEPVTPFVGPIVQPNSLINAQPAGPTHSEQHIYYPEPSKFGNFSENSVIKTPFASNKNISNPRKRLRPGSNANTQPFDAPLLSQKTYQLNPSAPEATDMILVPKPSISLKKGSSKQSPSKILNTKPLGQPATSQLVFSSKPSISQEAVKNLALNTNRVENDSSNPLKRPYIGAIRFLPRSLAIKKKKS